MTEITEGELADCWGYGYYLRACEMSAPDEARSELARVGLRHAGDRNHGEHD